MVTAQVTEKKVTSTLACTAAGLCSLDTTLFIPAHIGGHV